jgi:hypothetical protein
MHIYQIWLGYIRLAGLPGVARDIYCQLYLSISTIYLSISPLYLSTSTLYLSIFLSLPSISLSLPSISVSLSPPSSSLFPDKKLDPIPCFSVATSHLYSKKRRKIIYFSWRSVAPFNIT